MSEFDDEAPMPPMNLNFWFWGDKQTEPLDDATEKLFDSLGIEKRRHLRAVRRAAVAPQGTHEQSPITLHFVFSLSDKEADSRLAQKIAVQIGAGQFLLFLFSDTVNGC